MRTSSTVKSGKRHRQPPPTWRMASVRAMASSSSPRPQQVNSMIPQYLIRAGVLVALVTLHMATPAAADESLDRLVELGAEEARVQQLLDRWQDTYDSGAEDLIETLARAMEAAAPADLVIDKAAEGVAKRIPIPRLLPALRLWSEQIALAAQLAVELSGELDTEGMTHRDMVLRLQILQRARGEDAWLRRLRDEALRMDASVADLLAIGESISQLARLGLPDGEADELGHSGLGSGVDALTAPSLLRAIETAQDAMPLAVAARLVTERTAQGWTAEDVLSEINSTRSDGQPFDSQGRDQMPAARGMAGDPTLIEQEPAEDASRETDDAGRLYDENGRLIGEQRGSAGVDEDENGRTPDTDTDTDSEGEVQDRDSQETNDEQETDANGRG